DGEPQGTAGQPMLEVFRREGIENVCCVVTRYFGGVLLGTGGLLRAYTRSAKDALAEAGRAVVRQWAETAVECPYNLLERVKQEVTASGGILGEIEYGAQVLIPALLPAEDFASYAARITELTAGQCEAIHLGECFRAAPVAE
ncbi:MAG: YigZ family protein, partial [Oscillospiraceae bacterium]|nr:YigZ family protein [Oscillospiraceae bacterium]